MTRLKQKKELPSTDPNDVRFGTPYEVADYRAERLCEGVETVIEIGAGAGFQTGAFAERSEKVIAVDIDRERLKRGNFPGNVVLIPGDAMDPVVIKQIKKEIVGKCVVFLDPERPASSKKRKLDEIQPNLKKFVEIYSEITEAICMEMPPFLEEIPWNCEKEFISINGQLNRLNVYLGSLKKCDISVVRLPEWKRVEHSGPLKNKAPEPLLETPKYILLPDKAVEHAGITNEILPDKYIEIHLGNKRAFLVQDLVSSIFSTHKIVASGDRKMIEKALPKFETVILHGGMSQTEQKKLLKQLNQLCIGNGRAHLFMSTTWYLTTR